MRCEASLLPNPILISQDQARSSIKPQHWKCVFVQITNPYVYICLNIVNNKIVSIGDPTDATDGVNLKTFHEPRYKGTK